MSLTFCTAHYLTPVHAFLSPTYLVLADYTSIDDLIKALPTLTSPRPVAVYISSRIDPKEQDEAEKRIGQLNLGENAPTVVKASAEDRESEKYKHLSREDVVPRMIKDTLDRVELREIPANAAAVSGNAV